MKRGYLVCYDISGKRRLPRVFRLLKGIGVHLQYSVFYCSLTWPQLKDVEGKLSSMIDRRKDDIRIYPLPSKSCVTFLGESCSFVENVELFEDGRSLSRGNAL